MELRKRVAAVVHFAMTGDDLDVATAGTPDGETSFRIADALIRSGLVVGDTDTHWANGLPRLLTPEAYERLSFMPRA